MGGTRRGGHSVNAEVRAVCPDEAEAVLETLCAAFDLNVEAARPIFYGDPFYDLSHKRLLSLPEVGLVSCLTVVPTILRVGGVPVTACGVAGVATRPEYQRRGYAGALLEATVPALWEELGYSLALLHPLSAPFYRVFGWETASSLLLWSSVPSSLPRFAEAASVRPALDTDWPAIAQVHAELTQEETGACVRDSRRWSLIALPVPSREAFVYEDASGITGYGLWERRETLFLLEMYARTPEARRGLLGFLAHQPEPTVQWPAPAAGLAQFGLPLAECSPEPDAMLRIVDLAAAFAAVHAPLYAPVLAADRATLTIRATDNGRPANTLPIRLTPDGVEPGSARDPAWLRADIRILSQLYLGYCTPAEAAECGLVTCDSLATLDLADRLFPSRTPYMAPLDQV